MKHTIHLNLEMVAIDLEYLLVQFLALLDGHLMIAQARVARIRFEDPIGISCLLLNRLR